MRHHGRGRWHTAIGLVCALVPAAAVRGDVFCAGNDEVLWIVWSIVIPDQSHPLVRMGYTDSELASFRVPFPEPRLGTVRRLAVRGHDLHLMYLGGAHHRYTRRGDFVELSVPGGSTPSAAAGDTTRDTIYVIRSTADVERLVEAHAEAALPATRPAFDPLAGKLAAQAEDDRALLAAHPGARYWIVEYAPGRWRPFAAVPAEHDLPDDGLRADCWLAADDGVIHLAWKPEGQGRPVVHLVRAKDAWSTPTTIPVTEATRGGALLLLDKRAVFVAFLPDEADAAKLNLLPIRAADDAWEVGAKLASGGDLLRTSPPRFSVTAYRGRIAVAVETDDESAPVRAALWPEAGGEPATPFVPLTRFKPAPKSWLDRTWTDTASFLVLVVIMVLLFWRRQDCLLLGAQLEPGWSLAGHGRRLLAFLMDLAPACVVTFPLWDAPLLEAMAAWMEQTPEPDQQQLQDVAMLRPLWIPWVVTRLVYVAYCAVFETLTAATPGKMAMRCAVRRLDGARAGFGLILMRNLARLIELEPLLYIWPMLLLVLMTRNRQRMGDLLARTVVVQQPPPADSTHRHPPPDPQP